jgi:hypothetical protein
MNRNATYVHVDTFVQENTKLKSVGGEDTITVASTRIAAIPLSKIRPATNVTLLVDADSNKIDMATYSEEVLTFDLGEK